MPEYANGKIYQVISPNHPLPYIGSTTLPLCKRMAGHRAQSNHCSSRIVIDAGDAYIELIEEYPCENREQLNRREGEIIRGRKCVNRTIAGRTHKEYHEENYDRDIARMRIYNEANRKAINAHMKAHRLVNRHQINTRQRAYRAKKKEQLLSACSTTTKDDALTSSMPTDPSTSQVAE